MATNKTKKFDVPLFSDLDVEAIQQIEIVSDEVGEKYKLETVDFSDPNRPKTCLEVDFPILQVNEVAAIETSATKPIYMMSKWWARRRSTVFRQLLISSALKAPKNEAQAGQVAWSQMYRKNHKRHGLFKDLNVVDIFMGGGTTVVEATRMGFQVTGIDLNPIAWWVVFNETNPVKPEELEEFYKYIEGRVKPQIMPFFTAASPRGFEGNWMDLESGKIATVDPITLKPSERAKYSWEGPEVIYTFWMKHIMCSDPDCCHITPQIGSSVVAEKTVKIKFYENCVCTKCGQVFDLELNDFRIAPGANFVSGPDVKPFAVLGPESKSTTCPHCSEVLGSDWVQNQKTKKGKPKSKSLKHHLVLPKKWLRGIQGKSKEYFGGFYGATVEQDTRWFQERSEGLSLIEVRGDVPTELEHSNFGKNVKKKKGDDTDEADSNLLVCNGCGRQQDPLSAIKLTKHLARIFPYIFQGSDPTAKAKKYAYNGRFFGIPDFQKIHASMKEFGERDELGEFIPKEELFYGYKTHFWAIPDHGYTHWYKMFTPRQLYVNSLLAKEISDAAQNDYSNLVKSHMYGAFQNFLRHNCAFAFWNRSGDKLEPHFSRNNYHPKATFVENGVFSDLGRGNFSSCYKNVSDGLKFSIKPYDLKVNLSGKGGKSTKVFSEDSVDPSKTTLICSSSTDLKRNIADQSVDLIVTDPPFGDNVNYAELADFFLVWMHKVLSPIFPNVFSSVESPKTLEAVTNKARHPGKDESGVQNADFMYDRLLTLCWREGFRILKPGGLMAFTFHHDKDVAWIGVLESLFNAGFRIEGTFPVRSDESKGDGDFGSEKIEYDIVHICRKRLSEPKEIFWATLRRNILESVKSMGAQLAQHRASGLHLADLEVIIRGEVLEQYSKHYGKVKKNLSGDLISVREILLEANSLARSLLQSSVEDNIPDGIDSETRIFLNLFAEAPEIEFGPAKKRMKGSGVSLEELVSNGWVKIVRRDGHKLACQIALDERWNSLSRKKTLKSDLDQVHFAVNCCLGNRQLEGKLADWESWIELNYKSLLPSVGPLLKYFEATHFGSAFKSEIGIAYRTLDRTLKRIKENDGEFKHAAQQMSLFGD